MQQLVHKFILKRLKSLIPSLNEQQLQIALSKGLLSLNDVEIAPIYFSSFVINATITNFQLKLAWSNLINTPIKIELSGIKVLITAGINQQPQPKQNSNSHRSLPLNLSVKITDLSIHYLKFVSAHITVLELHYSKQFEANLQKLIITLNGSSNLEVTQVRSQVNLNDLSGTTLIDCIKVIDLNKKILKVCNIEVILDRNVYNKPLVQIRIDTISVYWSAHILNTIISNIQQLTSPFIEKKVQIRQTDPENFDTMALQVELKKGKLVCLNKNITIGRLDCINCITQIKVSRYIADVLIEAQNVTYMECSNYPHKMMVKDGFQMISSEVIAIAIKVYDDYCPVEMISDDLYNFVEINLKTGIMHYIQQPFLRFMDWLIEQFISLIIKDFGVVTIPEDIIEQKLRDHRFTSIKLNVQDITVNCRPVTTNIDFIKLTCESFSLHTEIRECSNRSNQTIWETLLCMEAKDLQLSQGQLISNKLNCDILVSKCGFTQLYLLKQIPLDRTFKIAMHISDPKLQVSKKTYLLIMQILFNNILYDDSLDPLYLLQVSKPTPIILDLHIDQVTLDCEDDLLLIAHQLDIRFHRKPDGSQISTIAQNFAGYHKKQLILASDTEPFLEYSQSNQISGSKNIQILIKRVNGTLNLNWLFTSINFFLIDDTVQIILPQDFQTLKPLSLELIIEKANVILQPQDDDISFFARGNLILVFLKNQSQDVHYAYHTDLEPVFDDNTQTSCLKIESSELSLFVNERGYEKEVFQPISLQWKSQNFQCFCFQTHQFLNDSSLNIENLKLYLTIEQCLHLIKLTKYLIQSMWDANQFGDKWNEQYSLVSQSRKSFNFNLELWLMSSKKDTLVPVLTASLSSTPLIMHQSYQKLLLSGNCKIEASYFNPMIGILEPILEKFAFDLMFLRNKIGDPGLHLQIETSKTSKFSQLNVIVHQNLLILVNDILNSKNKERKQSQQIVESPQNDLITLFNIKNYSGYDLTITIDDVTLNIENGSNSNFNTKLSQMDVWRKYNRLNVEFSTLNKKLIKLNKVEQNSQQMFKIDRQQCFLYFTSYLNKLTRTIHIQGQLSFENCTLFAQQVDILNQGDVIWSKILLVNDKITPPGEFISDQLFIRFTLPNRSSQQMVSLKSLFQSEFTYLEICQDNHFTILMLESESSARRQFKLAPSLVIQNSLPSSLNVIINEEHQSIAANDSLQLYEYTQKNVINYSIETGQYASIVYKYAPFQQNQTFEIKLINDENEQITIQSQIIFKQGTLYLYFYPKICLINTTMEQLEFYTLIKKRQTQIALFHKNYTFLNSETNLILSYEHQCSNEVSIKAIGDTSVEIKVQKDNAVELLEFGINISLLETVKKLGLYSTIIEIAPRYVIINQTESILQVQQQDSYGSPFNIDSNQRMAFNWADCRKEKMIAIRLRNTKWSEGIYLSDMRTIHFCLQSRTDNEPKIFMQCAIAKKKATFYISFLTEVAPYRIENKCPNFNIRFAQISSEQEESIDFNQSVDYSWTFPSLKPILLFNVSNNQDHSEFQLDLFRSDSFYCQKVGSNFIYYYILFQDGVKVITLKEIPEHQSPSEKMNKLIYVNLQMATISVIVNNPRPQELNLVTLSNVEIGIQEINRIIAYQFKVKFLNIDNNYSYDAINQVLLTPQQFQQYLEQQNYALDIRWAQNHQHSNILMIEYFFSYIAPLEIKLDQEYLYQLLLLKQAIITERQDSTAQQFATSKYLFNKSYQTEQNPFYEWLIIEIPPPSGSVYIKQLILPVLKVQFSFQTLYQQNQNFIVNVIANSLDFAVKNIENAPITLQGIKMQSIFDTQQGLRTLIKEHYKFALLRQILPILGSIEIIGNPTSFLNRISTGVVDLIEKPIEAMSLGPLELGLGVLQGASSLIKNTVAGAFYSVNKITGSIGNQISLLSFDEEYIQQRRKFMQRKPTQLFEGVYFGMQALIRGVGEGIVGFFQHPYQHGRKDGAAGILKGSTIGVAGVVIKPLTGVFDAASKTAEGLTNTATYFDDQPNTLRMRDIRAFYENSRYIKSFNEDDSYFLKYLNNQNILLIDTFRLFDIELKKSMYLIITQTMLFYVNKQSGIKWQQQANVIKDIKLFPDQLDPNILRLYLFCDKEIVFKLKFQKVPYSYQIVQKLENMIELN